MDNPASSSAPTPTPPEQFRGNPHIPELESSASAVPPAPGSPSAPPPAPRPNLRREQRNHRLVCCLALVLMLVLSALGGVVAYYFVFVAPEPF